MFAEHWEQWPSMVPRNGNFQRALIMISGLKLGDTLLLKSAFGSCLIYTLSGWLAFAYIIIKNLIHTLGRQEIPCFHK